MSPHSIYQALLLAFYTAAGHTERTVRRALQLPDGISKLDVLRAHKVDEKLVEMRSLNSSSYELRSANRLFIDKSQNVRRCIADILNVSLTPPPFPSSLPFPLEKHEDARSKAPQSSM